MDLVLGNASIMPYADWQAAPPSDQELADRVDLFILGRFGATMAKQARKRALPATATARARRKAS